MGVVGNRGVVNDDWLVGVDVVHRLFSASGVKAGEEEGAALREPLNDLLEGVLIQILVLLGELASVHSAVGRPVCRVVCCHDDRLACLVLQNQKSRRTR